MSATFNYPPVFSCPSAREKECKRLLIELQTSEHFLTCTCQPWINGTEECQEVQILVFLHTCVIQGNYPNISWSFPRFAAHMFGGSSDKQHEVKATSLNHQHQHGYGHHHNYHHSSSSSNHNDADGDTDDATEEGSSSKMSCIGIRKACLRDAKCRRLLTDYRHLCRENKKSQECLVDDVDKCYEVIEALKTTSPGLFNCACHMRRTETKKKCERIQWRLANNSCLCW